MEPSSLSLASPPPMLTTALQRVCIALTSIGLLMLLLVWASGEAPAPVTMLSAALSLLILGVTGFVILEHRGKPAGVRNNGVWFRSLSARGVWGWLLGLVLTGFYACLYWFPGRLKGLIALFDPLSTALRGVPADPWFVYGTLYTLAVVLMGFRFAMRYRYSRYQVLRTLSVVYFQFGFAWALPGLMLRLQQPELYWTYFWPLSYFQGTPMAYAVHSSSLLGKWYFFIGLALFFVATPVLTYFYGKRWYCSWVCGCGGLAETAGDPFRHLSDKSTAAWRVERWMVHGVLLWVVCMTVLLWVNVGSNRGILHDWSQWFYQWYAFLIGAMFSGVVGVGFYPIMGSRVWCRYGCPMAAWLGLWQRKASRFRITVNGGQCISCGNCSVYCEMGIDVRQYAQRGQDVVRASCVGCGMCAAVCPRGVLRLENIADGVSDRASRRALTHED